ncbi:FxsA family protein [Jidongwangia harbinensis]|uniref:FxsA family protein n=1 Tax=Jidongwangia harbinensis TaxID=2878561 RepID=UPI001CD9D2AC|nr:FxsA family protein [Jidongwangia harbinensis]MCA2214996.1 FxsA family protein [Jidongwangia harbinensis]
MRRGLALLPIGMLLLAVAEIAVFVAVVQAIGALWSILLLAVTSLAGLALLRREGIRGWRAFRAAAESGRPPGPQVSNSLVGLLGALLLASPGFLSAAAGLLLITPPTRGLARRGVERATERRVPSAVAGDLFGPRRVRVKRGTPTTTTATATADEPAVAAPAQIEGEVVEGEIVR